jgi:predicted PurR-regulated permease PerM
MKLFSLLIFASVIIFGGTYTVSAQTSTASTTENGSGIFDSVIEKVTDITETVQEQLPRPKPAPQTILSERAQERVTNLAANISNRFDGIIARLQNITNRLNTRVEKLEASGIDVTLARISLSAADTALDDARGELGDIDEAVARVIGSSDPKTEWQNVRAKFMQAREHVRTAHTQLRNTVVNLKETAPATTTN